MNQNGSGSGGLESKMDSGRKEVGSLLRRLGFMCLELISREASIQVRTVRADSGVGLSLINPVALGKSWFLHLENETLWYLLTTLS